MIFRVIGILSMCSVIMNASYIKEDSQYSLINGKKEYYMQLVRESYEANAYPKKMLQKSLSEDDNSDLGNALRIIAYDEVKDNENVQKYINKLHITSGFLKTYPPLALALADIYLRQGKYNEVLQILPRRDIVVLSKKLKQKAYYYRGMAIYLKNGTYSDEFRISMNYFEITKKIYYGKRKR